MPFLDTTKKIWKLKDTEIPVIENVPMTVMKQFRDKQKEAGQLKEKGGTLLDAMRMDEEWWTLVCKIGLNKTMEEVWNTGITEPQFRDLMAEVYSFLTIFGTVEEAKLSDYYVPKT